MVVAISSVAVQWVEGVDLQTSRLGVLAGGRRLELNGKRHDGCDLIRVLLGGGCGVRWFGMAQQCLLREGEREK
jgi:hypothetical protein